MANSTTAAPRPLAAGGRSAFDDATSMSLTEGIEVVGRFAPHLPIINGVAITGVIAHPGRPDWA